MNNFSPIRIFWSESLIAENICFFGYNKIRDPVGNSTAHTQALVSQKPYPSPFNIRKVLCYQRIFVFSKHFDYFDIKLPSKKIRSNGKGSPIKSYDVIKSRFKCGRRYCIDSFVVDFYFEKYEYLTKFSITIRKILKSIKSSGVRTFFRFS